MGEVEMKKNSLHQFVWVITLLGLMFAAFSPTTTVSGQDFPPVDPTGPDVDNPSEPIIPDTGGEPVVDAQSTGISVGTIIAIAAALLVILLAALVVGDGYMNRVE